MTDEMTLPAVQRVHATGAFVRDRAETQDSPERRQREGHLRAGVRGDAGPSRRAAEWAYDVAVKPDAAHRSERTAAL